MPKSFTERRKILKNANYLDLTPTRSYEYEKSEEGTISVLVPKFTNILAKKFILPLAKAKVVKIKLDRFGGETWQLIDGKRKVDQIGKELVKIFGEDIQPVDERVTRFLTTLYEQRLISFNEIN
jgi:hypothetical protein